MAITSLVLLLVFAPIVSCGTVSSISPHYGSLNGATKVTVWGTGFAINQFNFGNDSNLGNEVRLVSASRSFECDVLPDESTQKKIVCYTRRMPEENYYAKVSVDGNDVPLSSLCKASWRCGRVLFRPRWLNTPSIQEVEPRTSLPGSIIKICGNLFTALYGTDVEKDERGLSRRIKRVYIGGSKCELKDPSVPDKFYGLKLTKGDYGCMECKIEGSFVGNMNISYIIDQHYGRSMPKKHLLDITAYDKIAMFQTYAAVDSISPSKGSFKGGTRITIKGRFFDNTTSPAEVRVGGQLCKIRSLTSSEIVCTTEPFKKEMNSTHYPGNRGIYMDIFHESLYTLDNLTLNEYTKTDVASRLFLDSMNFYSLNSPEQNRRFESYFIPPKTCNYTFYGKADDWFQLYFSVDGPAEKKKLVAYSHVYTRTYKEEQSQKSQSFYLKEGNSYYMEVLYGNIGGKAELSIAAFMYCSGFTNVQSDRAINERQKINITSTLIHEKQSIHFSSWPTVAQETSKESQKIRVLSNFTDECIFRIGLYKVYTAPLTGRHTAEELTSKVNDLMTLRPDNVTILKTAIPGGFELMVTFHLKIGDRPDLEIIQDATSPANATFEVHEMSKGGSAMRSYLMSFGGVPISNIDIDADASAVETAINSALGVRCPDFLLSSRAATYIQDYEKKTSYKEYGSRTREVEPFCGKMASKNPSYIFAEGNGSPSVSVFYHKYICFAYFGKIKNKVYMKYYVRNLGETERRTVSKTFKDVPLPRSNSWGYTCIDMKSLISSYHPDAMEIILGLFKVYFQSTFYIDTVSINVIPPTKDYTGLAQLVRLRPYKGGVQSVSVTGHFSDGFNLTIFAKDCASDFPLFTVEGAQTTTKKNDSAVFRFGEASVQVKRLAKASLAPGGTFSVAYGQDRLDGVSATLSAKAMQDSLETLTDIGSLTVTRTGSCLGYEWTAEWLTRPGDQSQLEIVDSSDLTGTDTNVTTATIEDGGIFYSPIPGQLLRSAESKPQVSVLINRIPSICAGNCSFQYSSEATSTITNVQPTSGSSSAGTVLIISGSGFDGVNIKNNSVVIGGVPCDVIIATSTEMECSIGEGPAGTHEVMVFVDGKGAAEHEGDTPKFTYEFDITGFSPSSGSSAGGQNLTIRGTGFSETMKASVGSFDCKIISVDYSHILCVTTKGSGSQDIQLFSGETSSTYDSSPYVYKESPKITALSVTNASPIDGKVPLVISGSNFGSASSNNYVRIGKSNAPVQSYSDSEITVTLPALSPGQHEVEVYVDGVGYADNSAVPAIKSILEVNNIFPVRGSLSGGTLMTISGKGFNAAYRNKTKVMIGEKECKIKTVTSVTITCSTRDYLSHHRITNQGVHPDYGKGYTWKPAKLQIYVGDTVTWSWSATQGVTVNYAVRQKKTPTDYSIPSGGFSSGAASSTGSFSHQFNRAGTFYFWSGKINEGNKNMSGVVSVLQKEAVQEKVKVTLNDHEAIYTRTGINPTDSSKCGATYDSIDGCDTDKDALVSKNQHSPLSLPSENVNNYYYTGSRCATPIVTSVKPNKASANAVFVIKGRGFSDELCQNNVMFGEVSCDITSANAKMLRCKIDDNSLYVPGTAMKVSASVHNLGKAIMQIESLRDRNVVLVPYFKSVEPTKGSTEGGMRLTITGSGFRNSLTGVLVNIVNVRCEVKEVAQDRVVCVTGKGYAVVNGTVAVSVRSGSQWLPAKRIGQCVFSYSMSETPVVSVISASTITREDSILGIEGTGFGSENSVYIGDTELKVLNSTESKIYCNTGSPQAGEQPLQVTNLAKGKAKGDFTLMVEPSTITIAPLGGSTAGGQHVTISTFGLTKGVEVRIRGKLCKVSWYTAQKVTCITPEGSAGRASVKVISNGNTYPLVNYMYYQSETPVISSVSPSTGLSGDIIVIIGDNFGKYPNDTSVNIGGTECLVTAVMPTSIECKTGAKSAGEYGVALLINSLGKASSSPTFTYMLVVSSISPTSGSFAGGQNLSVSGSGFDGNTTISICNRRCEISSASTSTIHCVTPSSDETDEKEECEISVSSGSATASLPSAYTYESALTADLTDVSPKRATTGGGTRVTLTGSGFGSDPSIIRVSFAGTNCPIDSVTPKVIICITGSHSPSIKTKAVVLNQKNGIAKQANADFQYIDVWSSRYTWGGSDPPVEGDFVVIPSTMTVLLDTDTPVLALLLIDGGKLIFAEKNIELHAEKILITKGGELQVGTEDKPFQHNATIMLHGHVRSKELPIYGTKMIAVRNGTLDLHGRPHDVTWTNLAVTADAGASAITLQSDVDWEVGDQVVIATTGYRHSQNETEVRTITAKPDKRTLEFQSPLKFKHLGETLSVGGRNLEARAEVGLLTRNVVVRGNNNAEWNDKIEACPDGFDTGEFAVQKCFHGKFGEEIGSDENGVHIMIGAPKQHSGVVTARISNVEVTYAGQAYRLGRYAIHYHLNGDMAGSYVKNCAIHKSFNRAVNIHATNYIVVENNVAYDIMGGAFFLEDGVEIGNVFDGNLAIFVKQSTSLRNDDLTPAAFWITNPNNTVRHNHVTGGTHFGYWYRMLKNPAGASFDPKYCPQKIPLGIFYNNTAHSLGWFGLWIFPAYFPMKYGKCSRDQAVSAEFRELVAWNNEKGAECVSCGAVQFKDFVLVNNEKAGMEWKLISQAKAYSKEQGATAEGGMIGASPDDPSVLPSGSKTKVAVVLPYSRGLGIHGVMFVNFNGSSTVFQVTTIKGKSDRNNGGFTYQVSKSQYKGVTNKIRWRWVNEGVIKDLDGTTCGTPGCSVAPYTPSLPPDNCTKGADEFSVNPSVPGAVCDSSIKLHRWAFNGAPKPFHYTNAKLTNSYGTTTCFFAKKRVTHGNGWHCLLVSGSAYTMEFSNSLSIANFTYVGTMYDLEPSQYVILKQNFTQRPDRVKVLPGSFKNASATVLDGNSNNGDWYMENNTNLISYIVSGRSAGNVDRKINFQVQNCFFTNCVLPDIPKDTGSSQRQSKVYFWEHKETWKDAGEGWGGNYGNGDYGPPRKYDNVAIPEGQWVVIRTKIPPLNKLYVYGVLEFEYLQDDYGNYYNLTLSCTHIVITGRLIIGWKRNPFLGNAVVELRGDHSTPDIKLINQNIGSKVIAAFGGLEIHGKPHDVTWTRLASSAKSKTDQLRLVDRVDWSIDDEIVIGPSGFTPWEVDIRKITAISTDGMTLTLNQTLQYTHTVNRQDIGSSGVYLGSEVGLLSRNVKIVGSDYPKLFEQSFGVRILIGSHAGKDGTLHIGHAHMSDVECYHCGQQGWMEIYDPRYSLAFLNIGATSSYITKSSFFHSFSPGIGIYGANGVRLEDNVIYHTVGSAIIDGSVGSIMKNNLVALVVTTGYTHAGFEIQNARLTRLEGNVVAGSEVAGFRTAGEPCTNNRNPVPYWTGNIAHSCVAGVAVMLDDRSSLKGCAMLANFTTYRCVDYGFYYQSPNSFELVNVVSIDNQVGLYDMVIGPSATKHSFAYKYVKVRDSVFVGTSDGFDCDEHKMPDHSKDKNMLRMSSSARSWRAPGGGRVGQAFATFSSSKNRDFSSANHGSKWAGIHSYNSLYGIKHITGSSFINFATACGKEDYAITTMPRNDDLIHPLRTARMTLINVKSSNRIFIHRPNFKKIALDDCGDMDCDAYKKCILTDSDGSLLGKRGSAISQSEYEWNGDRKRGLGDYRIPKTFLTNTDGARKPVHDIAPEKGIIRDKSCAKDDHMQSWVCGDTLDYKMAIIESMDSDTETRRLSPVAVLGDGYLDLINGPQDHGWCLGYSCRKRLSTFGAVVATGKTYEIHFTGTSPQNMRLHLLNSKEKQAYVFKIFYTVPMRLDVFISERYIAPKNSDSGTEGTGLQTLLPPSFDGEFHPNVSRDPAGTNFWDPVTNLLYVLVRGKTVVDIKTSKLIVIAFNVPSMTVDEFFGKNIVKNLALFLGIPASRIKIAKAGRQSRRRLLAETAKFVVEISNPPGNDTSLGNSTASASDAINSTQFANISAKLINAAQLGKLSDVMNTTLSDITVTEPVPDPSDPSWATVTASLQKGYSYSYRIQLVDRMEMVQKPVNGRRHSPFVNFPVVHMLDKEGNHVGQLGPNFTQWEFTASLSVLNGSSKAFLTGNSTLRSVNGWANFTTLGVSSEGSYRIDIAVTSPPEAAAVSEVSFTVQIQPKTFSARFVQLDSTMVQNETRLLEIEIIEEATHKSHRNIFWKGHQWFASISLHMPEIYLGRLMGNSTTKMFDKNSSTAAFNLSFSSRNRYFLRGQVWSVPADYFINIVSDPIDVLSIDDKNRQRERSANVILIFPYDFDTHVKGKETYFAASVMNQLTASALYTNVTMHSYSVSKGSIRASFVMSGMKENVSDSLSKLESQLKSGLTVTFGGNSLTAGSDFMVDGKYYATKAAVKTLDDSGLAWFEILIIVLACVLLVGITVALILAYIHNKNKKKFRTHSETSLQRSQSIEPRKSSDTNDQLSISQLEPYGPLTFDDSGSREDLRYEQYIGDEQLRAVDHVLESMITPGQRNGALSPLSLTSNRLSSGDRRNRSPLPPIFSQPPPPAVPSPVRPLPDTP